MWLIFSSIVKEVVGQNRHCEGERRARAAAIFSSMVRSMSSSVASGSTESETPVAGLGSFSGCCAGEVEGSSVRTSFGGSAAFFAALTSLSLCFLELRCDR